MNDKDKMLNGDYYNPNSAQLIFERNRAKTLCQLYNSLMPEQKDEKEQILNDLIGNIGGNIVIEPNFFCDYGYNITINGFVCINHNCVFLDCAKITIGHRTLIGPNCGFYTAIHPINSKERVTGKECAKPIKIGENVWIGGGVTVLAGVTIGDGAVIGAGSVVTKDIPPNVVAVGNPCKVIKEISE